MATAREFIMKSPSYYTKQRIKEVQFWLIIQQLKSEHGLSLYLDNIIENLSLLFGCKITNINYAIANLDFLINRPNALELGLTNKYADVQIRTVCKVAKIANKTVYNALEKYVEEGSPDLVPRLSEALAIDIEKFNTGMKSVFEHISNLIKPGVIYD